MGHALPRGLEKGRGCAGRSLGISDIETGRRSAQTGNKHCFEARRAVKKGQHLIIDVPLRIQSDSDVQIVSQVFAGAKGYTRCVNRGRSLAGATPVERGA